MLSLLLQDSGLQLVMSVSILLFGGVLNLCALSCRGDGGVPTWSTEGGAYAHISRVCSRFPPPLPPASRGMGAKGLGRELISSSLSVLLLRGPTSPSLTLASAPLTREHRGTPIPARHWLPFWSRGTGAPDDMAAQGWELGPQLGARCLRSPSTCRPVRDTVCASFCREYLNTSLLAMGCVPGGFRKANPTQ